MINSVYMNCVFLPINYSNYSIMHTLENFLRPGQHCFTSTQYCYMVTIAFYFQTLVLYRNFIQSSYQRQILTTCFFTTTDFLQPHNHHGTRGSRPPRWAGAFRSLSGDIVPLFTNGDDDRSNKGNPPHNLTNPINPNDPHLPKPFFQKPDGKLYSTSSNEHKPNNSYEYKPDFHQNSYEYKPDFLKKPPHYPKHQQYKSTKRLPCNDAPTRNPNIQHAQHHPHTPATPTVTPRSGTTNTIVPSWSAHTAQLAMLVACVLCRTHSRELYTLSSPDQVQYGRFD